LTNRAIYDIATEAILRGETNAEALSAVKTEKPEARTSLASVNWYRNKLRSNGHKVLTSREIEKKSES